MSSRNLYQTLSAIAFLAIFIVITCQKQAIKESDKDSSSNVENADSLTAPRLVKNANPIYPEQALREGIEGVVWIKVVIDSTGKVTDATIVKDSGKDVGFEEAALNAAYKTKWAPALDKGRPTAMYVTYKIEFAIR